MCDNVWKLNMRYCIHPGPHRKNMLDFRWTFARTNNLHVHVFARRFIWRRRTHYLAQRPVRKTNLITHHRPPHANQHRCRKHHSICKHIRTIQKKHKDGFWIRHSSVKRHIDGQRGQANTLHVNFALSHMIDLLGWPNREQRKYATGARKLLAPFAFSPNSATTSANDFHAQE